MLLGALVEKLYGKSWGAALRDEIAQPLGLETLAWCGDLEAAGSHAEAAGSHAKGYYGQPDSTAGPAPFLHPSQLLSGGVCSNAADVARWNRALHGGKVLSAATYAAVTTPTGVAAELSSPYGFGLYVRPTTGGETVILHDGIDTGGYSNENVWYPDESLFSNDAHKNAGRPGARCRPWGSLRPPSTGSTAGCARCPRSTRHRR